jgi:phage host-nuclease inhibitor protein Gam
MWALSSTAGDLQVIVDRANVLIGQIGSKRRAWLRKEKELEDELQKLKDERGPGIDRIKAEERALIGELTQLVMANFMQLVKPGTKTVSLRNGEISLRESSRPALEITEGVKEETVINRIRRARGVRKYLRVKYELDKDALKAAPDFVKKIKDLSIVRRTTLLIRPTQVQGEKIKEKDPLNVTVPPQD